MFWIASSANVKDITTGNNMHALAMEVYEKHFRDKRTMVELGAFIGFLLSQFGLMMLPKPEDAVNPEEAIPHGNKSSKSK